MKRVKNNMQTDQKYKMYLWKQKKEYYTEENGKILFKEDTPMEIIESYELWQKQMQKLNDFPTKRASGLFSFLERDTKEKPKQEPAKALMLAKAFIQRQNEGLDFSKEMFAPGFIMIDAYKKVYTSYLQIPKYNTKKYMIQTYLKNNDTIALLWTMEDMDKVTIFTFDKDKKITKVQEFVCSN